MAGLYWDTSALVKYYHPELGTDNVDQLLGVPGAQHIISRLSVTQTFSVFSGKVRGGLIKLADLDELCRRFLGDTKRRVFSVARLLVAHHREAERLLRQYGPQPGQGVRTLDCLHLAVAMDLRSKGVIDTIVCADVRFLVVAQAEGFATINPERS